MTSRYHLARSLVLCAVVITATACASRSEVRQLAEKAAANTAALGVATKDLTKSSRRLAERRADNIGFLRSQTMDVQARVELDKALIDQIGDTKTLRLLDSLRQWSERVIELDRSATFDEGQFKAAVLESRAELDAKSDALNEVATQLAVLAKEDKSKARALFFAQFVKAVVDDVKEQREAAQQASQEGEQRLNEQQAAGEAP